MTGEHNVGWPSTLVGKELTVGTQAELGSNPWVQSHLNPPTPISSWRGGVGNEAMKAKHLAELSAYIQWVPATILRLTGQ